MKIAIYATAEGEKIKRLTLEYCQKWNCYPVIECYKNKDELLKVLEDKGIEILILTEGEEQNGEAFFEYKGSIGETKTIKIQSEKAGKEIRGNLVQKIEQDILLAEQITKGLSRCGIPSSNISLCRVHLKPVK